MTGYGRGVVTQAGIQFAVEISSVNRKQLDVAPVLPRELSALEGKLRQVVAERVTRGRVNVKVQIEHLEGSSKTVVADLALLAEYRQKLEELTGKPVALEVADILRLPGVLEARECGQDWSALELGVTQALEHAMIGWDTMRQTEGQHLAEDVACRLAQIEAEIEGIDVLAESVVANYRQQLLARLAQAGIAVDSDDERLSRELVLFADRCDTSEERTRLRSHLRKFRAMMQDSTPTGRSLDFLLQEMHREINTLGAKACDAQIAQHVVAAKTELEKVREQIQNIE